jgi:hypothetical protein
MRTAAITVYNSQKLEVFVAKLNRGFEVWIVGAIKGRRMILDHHLTHDDLEVHLAYAQPGDLVWREANPSEIPLEKHANAMEMEKTIKRRKFHDYDSPELGDLERAVRRELKKSQALLYDEVGVERSIELGRSVVQHLGSTVFLATGRKELAMARRRLLGKWTDGVVTLDIEADHKLGWTCADKYHSLNVGERVHGHAPDWWNFATWQILLLNNEHSCGTRVGVFRVDEWELHLSGSHPHQIANVFKRIGESLNW